MTLKRHKMPYTPKQSVFALEERHPERFCVHSHLVGSVERDHGFEQMLKFLHRIDILPLQRCNDQICLVSVDSEFWRRQFGGPELHISVVGATGES